MWPQQPDFGGIWSSCLCWMISNLAWLLTMCAPNCSCPSTENFCCVCVYACMCVSKCANCLFPIDWAESLSMCVCVFSCSWRFTFYLLAFIAGLAALIDVSITAIPRLSSPTSCVTSTEILVWLLTFGGGDGGSSRDSPMCCVTRHICSDPCCWSVLSFLQKPWLYDVQEMWQGFPVLVRLLKAHLEWNGKALVFI